MRSTKKTGQARRNAATLTAATSMLLAGVTTATADVYRARQYFSADDSPFRALLATPYFYLDDFEDSELNTPGVEASAGLVFGPASNADSVDMDDGLIDGYGSAGHSYWSGYPNSTGVTFTFDAAVLGSLPTHAGIVFTDGVATTTIAFLNAAGESIATYNLDDGSDGNSETAGDRFVGVIHDAGVAAIHITDNGNEFEVDHLQYGHALCPADLDNDGIVGIIDFLSLISLWGADPGGPPDLDFDGVVTGIDLLAMLAAWGTCPAADDA